MRSPIKKIQAFVVHPQIVVVFLAFALMVSLSSWFMDNILRKHLAYNAQVVLNALETQIGVDMLEPRTILGNLTQTVRSMILDGSSDALVRRYLKEINDYILLDNRQLLGFSSIDGFFNSFGGVFIDSMDREPPENYNPSERPWYKDAAMAGGSIVFLQPYADIVTGTVIITYARALYDNEGNILGVIALDLHLDRISEYIKDTNLGAMGYGFLLSGQMEILTHPNIDIFGEKLGSLSAGFAALENKLRQEHNITEYRMINFAGDASVLFIRQIENGWYIGIVTPEGVYYRELGTIRLILIILGIILALVLSTILYNIVAARKKADERTQVMLDATPLCANFWDSNFNHIDCNKEAVKMFGLSSKEEYSKRFFELSPEYQPDGRLSGEKAVELVKKAFAEGYCRFEWMHQKLNGEPIPCETILVRVEYNNDFMVAGYTRDLRELKNAITQMEESEKSLSTLENILNGLETRRYRTVRHTG
jgi:PAS domain-containing protein